MALSPLSRLPKCHTRKQRSTLQTLRQPEELRLNSVQAKIKLSIPLDEL